MRLDAREVAERYAFGGSLAETVTLVVPGETPRPVRAIRLTSRSEDSPADLEGARRVEEIQGFAVRRSDAPAGVPLGSMIVDGAGRRYRVDSAESDEGTSIRVDVVRVVA